MGSLESATPLKRAPLLRASPSSGSSRSLFHRPRSRLARFLLFEKVDYLQWILTAAVFFFVVILFQSFLPGSVTEIEERDGRILKEMRGLDFGEGIRFRPMRLMEKWEREWRELNSTSLGREVRRLGVKRPLIAMVAANLEANGIQLEMISVAAALKEIGYDIQVIMQLIILPCLEFSELKGSEPEDPKVEAIMEVLEQLLFNHLAICHADNSTLQFLCHT